MKAAIKWVVRNARKLARMVGICKGELSLEELLELYSQLERHHKALQEKYDLLLKYKKLQEDHSSLKANFTKALSAGE